MLFLEATYYFIILLFGLVSIKRNPIFGWLITGSAIAGILIVLIFSIGDIVAGRTNIESFRFIAPYLASALTWIHRLLLIAGLWFVSKHFKEALRFPPK